MACGVTACAVHCQVYATDGDDELGGSDLDVCINDMLLGKVQLTQRMKRML